jgi:hypothetical protein
VIVTSPNSAHRGAVYCIGAGTIVGDRYGTLAQYTFTDLSSPGTCTGGMGQETLQGCYMP